MIRLILIAIGLMASITSIAQSERLDSSANLGIKFEKGLSWAEIKERAKQENKSIFIDIYATWCGPCKMMDKRVYPDTEVGDSMNAKFISVKVQMDTSQNDNEDIKKWYADAHMLAEEFHIRGYPTFLFFTPDGKWIHKDEGFKDISDFLKMEGVASDPQRARFYTQWRNYREGIKDYANMGQLARFTANIIADKSLAKIMAKDYKENFVDTLPEDEICTRANLDFIGDFNYLISSKDRYFDLCLHQASRVDQIEGIKGWAALQVKETINREEIHDRLFKNGHPNSQKPNWDKIQNAIAQKYTTIDARHLVLAYKIFYYRSSRLNWTLWARYKEEMMQAYPPVKPYGLQIYEELNMGGAWDAFLHCPDTAILVKGLKWIDEAISLDGPQADYLDTKANLLYKLGRKSEALPLEQEALTLTPKDSEKIAAYRNMQLGKPTWPR
jgi:thioredoxin-related protein